MNSHTSHAIHPERCTPKMLRHRRAAPDHRQIALVEIVEGLDLLRTIEARDNRLRRVGAALHRHLRHAGQRFAVRAVDRGQIAHYVNVRQTREW